MNYKKIFRNHLVFVDTSCFMVEDAEKFFSTYLIKELKEMNKKLIVHYKSLEKLKIYKDDENEDVRKKAKSATYIFSKLKQNNVIEVFGSEDDYNSNKTFIDSFITYGSRKNLCILTQNQTLVDQILEIRKFKSVRIRSIKALKINDKLSGFSDWEDKKINRLVSVKCSYERCKKPWVSVSKEVIDELNRKGEHFFCAKHKNERIIEIKCSNPNCLDSNKTFKIKKDSLEYLKNHNQEYLCKKCSNNSSIK